MQRAHGRGQGTNSRQKGKVGEREFAARSAVCRGANSPDVVSDALAWLHIEVKRTQALNLADACAQAEGDCGGKPWIVAHRRNHAPWLITLTAENFFQFLRGVLPPDGTGVPATALRAVGESPTTNKEQNT